MEPMKKNWYIHTCEVVNGFCPKILLSWSGHAGNDICLGGYANTSAWGEALGKVACRVHARGTDGC